MTTTRIPGINRNRPINTESRTAAAYQLGIDTGRDLATENYNTNNPPITEAEEEEFLNQTMNHEAEVYRQFSSFEHTAHEFNTSRDPESLWNAYETGIQTGIEQIIDEQKNTYNLHRSYRRQKTLRSSTN